MFQRIDSDQKLHLRAYAVRNGNAAGAMYFVPTTGECLEAEVQRFHDRVKSHGLQGDLLLQFYMMVSSEDKFLPIRLEDLETFGQHAAVEVIDLLL